MRVILAIFCALGLSLADEESLRDNKKFEIVPYDKETAEPIKGFISGAMQCGGPGKFTSLHAEVCKEDGAAVCTIPKGATGRHQLMFVPSEDIMNVTAKFTITISNPEHVKTSVYHLTDVNLVTGKEYLFKFVGGAKPEQEGKSFTTQLEFLHGAENRLELCAIADFIAEA